MSNLFTLPLLYFVLFLKFLAWTFHDWVLASLASEFQGHLQIHPTPLCSKLGLGKSHLQIGGVEARG